MSTQSLGPLAGVTVIELAGLGALPFATLKLADLGADVIRVHRASEVPAEPPAGPRASEWDRGRRSLALDLKHPDGIDALLRLVERADVFCEAFRPGVAERLGVGPEVVTARNPRIVYGRLTGWGQDGPLAHSAGHSLNYESITGAIGSIGGQDGRPVPLLQVIGDFAGGGLMLAFGIACALFEAQRSGRGQVIDAAMVDGAALLLGGIYGMMGAGIWNTENRESNLLDGGAHFYGTYETKDGKFVSIGSIEPQFYDLLLEKTGLKGQSLPSQMDRTAWGQLKGRLEAVFRTKTRDEWCAIMEGTDICFAPVLTMKEASQHPHARARNAYVDVAGFAQPAAAPVEKIEGQWKEAAPGDAAARGSWWEVFGDPALSALVVEAAALCFERIV